jgi:hypothetical protein
MAKIKNTGRQPRGFFTDEGTHVVVPPGGEAEFNMSEADYKHLEELVKMEDPPLYEISGGHGGVKKLNAKEQREADIKKAEEDAKKASDAAAAHEKEVAKDAKDAEKKKA